MAVERRSGGYVDWLGLKEMATQLGIEKDALHVYAAFLVHIVSAAVLRRPLSNWMPWAVVLLAAMINEVLDIRFGQEPQVQEWQVQAARHDLVNTMVLPTLLLILARYAPRMLHRTPAVTAPARAQPPGQGDAQE